MTEKPDISDNSGYTPAQQGTDDSANEQLLASALDLDNTNADSNDASLDSSLADSGSFEFSANLQVDQEEATAHALQLSAQLSASGNDALPDLTIDFSPIKDSSVQELDVSLESQYGRNRVPTGFSPSDQEPGSAGEEKSPENRPKTEPKVIDLDPITSVEAEPQTSNDSSDESGDDTGKMGDRGYWDDRPKLSQKELVKLADEHLDSPEALAQFKKDMKALEDRSAEDGVSDVEKETFYAQVGRVLEASEQGNEFYNGKQLQEIASGMMRHAGAPGTVNQGSEPTCTTAAMESVLYAKEPNTIGEVVSEAALTGQYVTANGDTIKIPGRNLMPDKYKASDPAEKARSLASHIAQPLLINVKWNGQDQYLDQSSGKKGHLVYEEGHPKDHPGDSQTRIMDYSTDPPQPVKSTVQFVDPLRQFQKDTVPFVIDAESRPVEAPMMFMDDLPKIYKQLKGNEGSLTAANFQTGEDVHAPESLDDFKDLLTRASRATADSMDSPSLPMLLGVHANLEPFHSDLQEYTARPGQTEKEQEGESAMHAHHAVAVFDYDPDTGMVTLENQWGDKADHTGEEGQKPKIHVDDLYRSFKGLSREETNKLREDKEDKELTPDELIEHQRKFVDEIAADSDQDPEKVWQERRELHRYLDFFERDGEASSQLETLVRDHAKLTESADFETKARLGNDLISTIDDTEFSDQITPVLNSIDESFIESLSEGTGTDAMKRLDSLIRLHEFGGDKEGATNVTHQYMDTIFGENSKLDFTEKADRRVMDEAIEFMARRDPEKAHEYLDQMASMNEALTKQRGHHDPIALESSADLLSLAGYLDHDKLAGSLAVDLQQTYDTLNKDVETEDDFKSDGLSDVRFRLRLHYQDTKQPEKLEAVVDDYIRFHEELRTEDGMPLGKDSPKLIDPLKFFADELVKGGATESGEQMFERALKLAREHDPESAPGIVDDLIPLYLRSGRKAEAEKLVDEFKLPRWRYRGLRS